MTTQKIKIEKRSIFSLHKYWFVDQRQHEQGGKDRCKTQNSIRKG